MQNIRCLNGIYSTKLVRYKMSYSKYKTIHLNIKENINTFPSSNI